MNTPDFYKKQLTAEHTEEEKQKNGTLKLVWVVSGEEGNHLGDTEKMHETRRDAIEEKFDEMREARLAKEEKEATASS